MQVQTYLFGTIEVDPETIITFPDGFTGFEDCKRFKLIHEQLDGEPVSYTLQSVDRYDVAFQIMDPATLGFHYELEVTEPEMDKLKVKSPEEVAVMVMLFKRGNGQSNGDSGLRASFRAPLLINPVARLGMQKVIRAVQPKVTLTNLSSAV